MPHRKLVTMFFLFLLMFKLGLKQYHQSLGKHSREASNTFKKDILYCKLTWLSKTDGSLSIVDNQFSLDPVAHGQIPLRPNF